MAAVLARDNDPCREAMLRCMPFDSGEPDIGWLADWGSFAVHATAIRGNAKRSVENYQQGCEASRSSLEGAGARDGPTWRARHAGLHHGLHRGRGLARSTVAGRRVGASCSTTSGAMTWPTPWYSPPRYYAATGGAPSCCLAPRPPPWWTCRARLPPPSGTAPPWPFCTPPGCGLTSCAACRSCKPWNW